MARIEKTRLRLSELFSKDKKLVNDFNENKAPQLFSDKHIQKWHISYSFKNKSSENELTSSQVMPFIQFCCRGQLCTLFCDRML